MKIKLSAVLFFMLGCFHGQEIKDRNTFNKCRKEFSRKICLSDKDTDGVLFYLDQCPEVSGPEDNNGCPWADTDNDGVIDKYDACPTVEGPEENNGCPWPDTDGDGVLDKDDACPTIPGDPKNKGCKAIPSSKSYTAEELQKIENDFLANNKNINYHALADYIFKKIDTKNLNKKVLYLSIYRIYQAGCGLDRTDYSDVNLVQRLIFQSFWDERNFKKFANLFPNKIILPIGRPRIYDYESNKSIGNLKGVPKLVTKYGTVYNAKGRFAEISDSNEKIISDSDGITLFLFVENNKVAVSLNEKDFYFRCKNSKIEEISGSEYNN